MHPWNVSPTEAIAIQQRLRPQVLAGQPFPLAQVRTIAGVDASYKEGGRGVAVLFAYPSLDVLETSIVSFPVVFPYVPGLLSFREAPLVAAAVEGLKQRPDLLMVDGQGYAHPRRLGLASHLGLALDLPSIGVAKSRLVGRFEPPGPEIGTYAPLWDHGEQVGVVLRSKPRTNPLFISIGYRFTLDESIQCVLACLRGYRLPEPTRIADKITHLPADELPV